MGLFVSSGGYTAHMYNHAKLKRNAERLAKLIPHAMERTGAQCIAVTGKSGQALAFATLMLIDFPLVVVRKENESSHGSDVEGDTRKTVNKYLILDDFIESGNTCKRIEDKLRAWAMGQIECVGVIEYDSNYNAFEYNRCNVIGVPSFGPLYDVDAPPYLPLTYGTMT